MSIRRAPDTRPARGGSTGRSHLGVGRLLGLLVPVLDRLELLRVALRLEAQLLDDRDEAVALVGRGRADPAADDVVDAHAGGVAAARDPLALVGRGRPFFLRWPAGQPRGRAAWVSTTMSAMSSCTSWCPAIGFPKALRWVEYVIDASIAACAWPTAPAATE